jgi:hypothetical protein
MANRQIAAMENLMSHRRPLGITARQPEIPRGELRTSYRKLSKADWAEAFIDLFCEATGSEPGDIATGQAIAEAERRVNTLRRYRKAEASLSARDGQQQET